MGGKKLILEATETGCIIPTTHKLNADGTGLAEVFGVSFSSACRWVREWKA